MQHDKVLLSGGGLDSIAYLIILAHRKVEFGVVHISYGQRPAFAERKITQYFCAKYNLPFYPVRNEQIVMYQDRPVSLFSGNVKDQNYVEGRNLSLIMSGLEYGKQVILGFTDPGYKVFPDADIEFIKQTNALLKKVFNRDRASVRAPYINTNRTKLMRKAYKLDNELFKAFTCWTPTNSNRECGVCKHCILKAEIINNVQGNK